jgi:hypothetical protein
MTKFALMSSPGVYAPGLIQWAINGYHFEADRRKLCAVVVATWSGVTDAAADALLSQRVPFTLEGEEGNEAVLFEVD